MLHIIRLVLAIFVFFLATPTVVSMIDNSCDTSVVYNLAEEERVVHSLDTFKADIAPSFNIQIPVPGVIGSNMDIAHLLHDYVIPPASIVIPPPELV